MSERSVLTGSRLVTIARFLRRVEQPCCGALVGGKCVVIDSGAQMALHEIVLPYTKPETEWIRGRALQKVSPTFEHAKLQLVVGGALLGWAGDRGYVGSEWRFRVRPPGEPARPLVPDVAYVSAARLAGVSDADFQCPPIAPDVVVEILSPDDRRADVDDKIATYLRAGSTLVIVLDPATRSAELHDAERTTLV